MKSQETYYIQYFYHGWRFAKDQDHRIEARSIRDAKKECDIVRRDTGCKSRILLVTTTKKIIDYKGSRL